MWHIFSRGHMEIESYNSYKNIEHQRREEPEHQRKKKNQKQRRTHPLQNKYNGTPFTVYTFSLEKNKKKTQKQIGVGGFRSALDHGWMASARRGRVSSWGVGGRRCSWLAVGRVRSPWVAGRGSNRPLLHLAATALGCRLHK